MARRLKIDRNAVNARRFRAVLPILRDMLAYEAEKFEAEPLDWYVHHEKWTRGPYDLQEEAEQVAARYPGAYVAADYGELDVNGGDMVDAFSEWRDQLKAALQGVG